MGRLSLPRLRAAMLAAGTGIALSLLVPLASIAQPTGGALAGAKDPRQGAFKEYAGAAVCKGCHAAQYEAWSRSHHRQAMQVANAESVLGDFRNAKFAYAGTTSVFSMRDGKYYVRTDGPEGKLSDFEIKYTFGVEPLQQYLIELPGGKLQALGIAWDSRPKAQGGQRWFHLYPGQNLRAGDPLHWTGINQNWNFMCAECHSTRLSKSFDAKSGSFGTTWAEIDVACEACHGPGADHVAKARGNGYSAADSGLAIALTERKGVTWKPVPATGNAQRSTPRTSTREIDMCARCHARAARISDDYVHGRPPQDTHRVATLSEGLYWNDGQIRDEVYESGSFAQSRMFAAGVTCSDCHEPHSQALRRPGNDVCTQCHQAAKFDAASHTHHAPGTPGAACIACHMPTKTYMRIDVRHDHSLRIPRPDLSVKFGTPNACNACHAKKTPQWAADAIHGWTGRAPTSYQTFAEALRAGTAEAQGARGALMMVIDDQTQPAIVRASAVERLGRMLSPSSLPSLTRALNDRDAMVRLAAVEGIGTSDVATRVRYLPRMLSDPVRSVRIEASRALAGPSEAQIPAAERNAFDKALAEYIAVQTYNADRPEGRMNLGNLYATRGDAERGAAEFRKALEIDPTSVEARVNLADLYRVQRDEAKAEAVLRQGIAISPRSAALHYALGLTLVRAKRSAESVRELGQAAKLAPDNARFAYVYAVALNDAGRAKDALKVLTGARKSHPNDRDLLFGLAHFSAAAGDRVAAASYAKKLTELDPDNREYAQLAASLAR
jgi:predicted CXXCH cytochrome family protein